MLLTVIGRVRSPFHGKFGVPRQAGLVRCEMRIELDPEHVSPASLSGLEEVSHLWVVWGFHLASSTQRPTVRPPRLGGNKRIGVFASRSPYRPNPIGLSAVALIGCEGLTLRIEGGDFADQTPVYDLKPYLPYADAIPDARLGWAPSGPERVPVTFANEALEALERLPDAATLRALIVETLALDPAPAYLPRDAGRPHGVRLGGHEVKFVREPAAIRVTAIEPEPCQTP